jgi:anti-sigma28 factor (negative regulator of flagellin synthesis)
MISKVRINTNTIITTSTQPEKKEIKIQQTQKTGRVEEIKKQIESGQYKIDLDKTAKAFAKHLL